MLDKPTRSKLELEGQKGWPVSGKSVVSPYLVVRIQATGASRFMLKTLPIAFVIIAVIYTIAFPTKEDAMDVTRVIPPESVGLESIVGDGPDAILLAANTPMEPVISQIEASGCLDFLPHLPEDMITPCSKLISDAVIQIAEAEANLTMGSNRNSALLTERLRLAAAKVCRTRWVSEPGIGFDADDPVCQVSTINLASSD